MKLLVVFGQNALGRRLMLRLTKEGCNIICADTKAEALDKVYATNALAMEFSDSLEEAFRLHNFEGVIYLGDAVIDGRAGHSGGVLEQALLLCQKYKVKRFMYVDQKNYEASAELAIRQSVDAEICRHYAAGFNGSFKLVQADNFYGEEVDAGLLLRMLKAVESGVACSVPDKALSLLYVDDFVDLLWRIWNESGANQFFKLQGQGFSIKAPQLYVDVQAAYDRLAINRINAAVAKEADEAEEMVVQLQELKPANTIQVDFVDYIQETGWRPKYSLQEKLPCFVEWYLSRNDEAEENTEKGWRKRVQPYAENIVLFAILVAISLGIQDYSSVNSYTGLDFAYVYILVMGLLYGKKQVVWSVLLSCGLLIYSYMVAGADMVGILYRVQPMVHMATYMFLGTAVGYITDAKNKTVKEYKQQLKNAQRRFAFLYDNYLESVSLKDTFYKQVLNNGNSLGRAAHIINQLESVRKEQLYFVACDVVSDFLDVDNVAIYTVGRNGYYLRLRVRKGAACSGLPQSLKIDDNAYLKRVVQDKQFFINKGLQKDLPDMAAPILYGDKAIAVIQLYKLPFEKFSVQSEVMMKVVSLLIAAAIKKAVKFEELLREKMYIEETRIMRTMYYRERLEEAKRQRELGASGFRRAQLVSFRGAVATELFAEGRLQELWGVLDRLVREEDVVGMEEDNSLEAIFFDLPDAFVESVTNRLKKEGVELRWLEN